MRMVKTLTFLVVVTLLACPAMAQQTLDVDCSAAEGLNTLAAALEMANSGDTISITGPCPDTKAQVTKDALSIVGAGEEQAVLDGGDQSEPVIMVDGARRVTIQNVKVMNGQQGLLAAKGAAVTVANVMAQGNAEDGFSIDEGATARLSDCTAQDNGDDGFGVLRSSNATFSGTITSRGNGDDGIAVVLNANGTFSGAQVSATNNGQSETFRHLKNSLCNHRLKVNLRIRGV
ncbi:MAG: right-handed parallel beta-helix repeat-containing protein [Candidatus Tectomicrobia bacterium]|nr:right-handed parallel beta-helix repeat-containing protein [Candidatus Tectomicrobia bacterium]